MKLLQILSNMIRSFYTTFIEPQKTTVFLLVILFFAVATKSWHLYHPQTYVFDEVYVGFTAEEYVKGNMKAWVWDYPTPKGFAYDWSHPPMGRLFMAVPIKLLGISSFSRRIMPLLAGVAISFVVFHIAKELFPKKPTIGVMAAALTALDGLLLVMSRTALADTILAFFLLSMIYFFLKKNYLLSSLLFGAAVATKWTAIYSLGFIGLALLTYFPWKKSLKVIGKTVFKISGIISLYLVVGVDVYLLSYLPLINHYGVDKFVELQKQMYWYHTGLKATHPYQSSALSWPLLLRPVWFFVDYSKTTVENIYALGNPLIFWGGLLAVAFTIWYAIVHKEKKLFYLLIAYAIFWVPWIFSPRIMFLYHYLPAIPFLGIILAFSLEKISSYSPKLKNISLVFLTAAFILFWFFYPYWTAIPVSKEEVKRFQWFESWQ
ncbi:MAG: glycosyltransferase family 39 protein [Patescibacteria group bacterium]|jgi:dolichyl-phosphate-mannose-protein mannosyltransferase